MVDQLLQLLGYIMPGRQQSKYEHIDPDPSDQAPQDLSRCKTRIMYIEDKSGGLEGPARIGRMYFSKTGKTLYYNGRRFQSLKGAGYKANYFDVLTGEEFWISGPRKDQNDRLYGGIDGVLIDDDVKDEYMQYLRGQQGDSGGTL